MQTKLLTVKQAAAISGVSVRTLHHYHKLGLLNPARVTESGYRLYSEKELSRLQQILLYKELDFSLEEIGALLNCGEEALHDALEKQALLLELKRQRLGRLIALTERLLKGEDIMDFKAFDTTELDEKKEQYAQEVKTRWGDTVEYAEYLHRTGCYGKEEWDKVYAGMGDIFTRFAACMGDGPASPKAQAMVREWREFISKNFYPCSDSILQNLAQMYEADPRFQATFEKTAPGLGRFIASAIKASV